MSKISFIYSGNRVYNIQRSLSLIKSDVIVGLKKAKRVVVKPNCVVDNFQLAATHVDALRAVFDFIKPYVTNQITLAEGTGEGDTIEAFKNYDYFSLQESYGFTVVDLNKDEFDEIELFDKNGKPWKAQIAKTILDSDYLITVSPPKTHNDVVYTGSIKNVAVGSLLRPEGSFAARIASKFGIVKNNKAMIHQGNWAINKNIEKIASKIKINLAVLDGFTSMQGNGPVTGGIMVPTHWAISSNDALLADLQALKLMGINVDDVGYLSMLKKNNNPEEEPFVIGDNWREHIQKFKLHDNYQSIKNWKNK